VFVVRSLVGRLRQSGAVDRTVTASWRIGVASPARSAVQVAAANPELCGAEETITVARDGVEIRWHELDAPHGGGCG
jgi:hypothetical protein